jgi:heme-degrading monooxygenase HmoA
MGDFNPCRWRYVTIWEFHVPVAERANFERIYAPAGLWAQLFSKAEGYVATELNRDLQRPGRYLTCDFWTSKEAYVAARQSLAREYASLDAACERLTERETHLGEFERIG